MAKNDTPEIPGLFDDLPEEAPQEQIAKISLRSWRTHLASIRTLDKRIEMLIDEAVKQALAQGRKLTSADIGRVFHRHPELRAAMDKTMQQLNDDLTATIEQGSKDAWLRANTAADAVVAAMANNNAQLAALLNAGTNKPQNDRALRAFQQREMQGLKLSDRVWRATEGMKLDMERAIEVALAEGVPAQKLSERVRELLKEPHRLYRRVRDKDGNLRLSQAAQKYHPGTGVYRSSYKNAMRVARTEVNMAYQASDSERWTRSWWVKGIRVSLSNNHTCLDSKGRPAPLVDICDELAGDYPADFKFTGWHPQCRCFATAITCEYTDIRDYYRRKRAGEDMTGYTPPGTITEPPEQFKRWMADNSDRLTGAAQRGTTPYFIANNAKYTDPNWKPSKATASADPMPAPRPKTPLEIADERHARRTAEEAEKIQKAWDAKLVRDKHTRIMADSVLKLHSEYPLDVDFSALEKIIAGNNLTKMREEARNVARAIKEIRAEEKALSDIIPNAHEWHKRFSIAQLQETKASVLRTFSKKGWGWDINNATELDALRRGLEHEVNWMGTKGKARYTTWEVSQSAYQEKLVWAEKRIEMLRQKNAIGDEIKLLRASRSTVGKQLVADFDKLFTDDATDINVLRAKAAGIKAKADQLEKLRAKKAAASATASSGIPFGGMTDEEAKKALIDYANKIGTRIDPSKIVVDHGFIHLQGDQQMYLYEALKAETAAEHKQLWNHAQIGGGHGGRGGYVQTGNSFVINGKFRNNGIFGKIDSNVEDQLRAAGLTADDIKTIKLLDKKIEEFSMPVPILATRYVDVDALTNIFGQSVKGKGRGTTVSTLESWKKAVEKLPTKNMQVDPAYLSASLNEMQNVFYGNYRVKLQIEIPPGTPMYMTDNYAESEIVLGRGTQLEFIGVSIQTITRNFGWAGDQQYHHVTIRCRVKR